MVAARENETAVEDVTDEERQRVYISLYQTHLPKLETAELIDYDEEERTVELVASVAKQGFFWMQPESRYPWNRYYAILGVLGWVLILGFWAGIPGFALLSWSLIAVLVSTVLLLMVLVQYLLEERAGMTSGAFETLVE
ncbi:hypothetical protein C439_18088 [Haloferax mediterranei ATCC 33500]|nr:hypothetical protein C439_18088 [Haloferax mediterranei ATCC 33500]